jgi:hypothetical protein
MIAHQHFGSANLGNLLLDISVANPLGAGTYTVRSQQLSNAISNYQLDLKVIPEPSTASLLLLALSLRLRCQHT